MSASTSLFQNLGADILAKMFEVAAHGLSLVDAERRFMHLNAVGCEILGCPYDGLVGRDLLESIPPEQRRSASRWFEQSLAGTPLKQDYTVKRPDGSERIGSFFCVPVLLDETLAGLMAFHDVTASRRIEFETRARSDIASRLARQRSVNDISSKLAEQVVEVTPAIASAVILLSEEPLRGRVAGADGLPQGFIQALEASLLIEPERLAERMPAPDQTQVITQLQKLYRSDPSREHFRPYLDQVQWDTLACVPLTYLGERTGALFTYFPAGVSPSRVDLAFLKSIADQSVFAIENARLLAAVQDKAALEERQRLARELHDSVSQALYGIALGTRSARSQLGRNPERVAERLDYVMNMAEAAISEMRSLIFELRPETLEQEGLAMALAKQASTLHARHGLQVQTDIGSEPPLSFAAKEALYRIAQEAFHNIVKHARANHVVLELGQVHGRVLLEVRDDGVGFDASASFPGHIGLTSMRERAEGMGGHFSVKSAPGSGTTLKVELPVGSVY